MLQLRVRALCCSDLTQQTASGNGCRLTPMPVMRSCKQQQRAYVSLSKACFSRNLALELATYQFQHLMCGHSLSKMSTLFSRNVANKSATRGTSIRAGPGLGSDTNVFKEWETCAQELDGNMTNYSAVTKINKIVDGALESFMFIDVITLPSRSLTCYFKMTVSKRNLLFQNAIFRLHVKLWEGNPRSKKHKGAIRFRFFFPPPLPTRYSRHEKWQERIVAVGRAGDWGPARRDSNSVFVLPFLYIRGFFSFFQLTLPFYHGKLDLFVCLR